MPKAYDKLLTADRLRPTSIAGRTLDDETLSDKSRIITSTSFRRLQVKAQVFSLEENAAVRTRLTHTLEVAAYGELIARKAAQLLLEAGLIDEKQVFAFVATAQNACLLHDLGNPPFGHLGEFAIRSWFRQYEKEIRSRWHNHGIRDPDIDVHYAAFKHFDGNPQTFRIITLLQWWKDEYGLNLTKTLLASTIKYLKFEPSPDPFCKKPGFFATENDRLLEIWRALGLKCSDTRPLQRHPIAFIMEAADDIAYCVSDIEDAIEKRVVTEQDFFEFLKKHLDEKRSFGAPRTTFLDFKVHVTRSLVDVAAKLYWEMHDAILSGSISQGILNHDENAKAVLTALKSFTKEYVFRSREAITVELSGFRILTDLLRFFGDLIFEGHREFERLLPGSTSPPEYGEFPLEQRMFSLLSKKHLRVYRYHVSKRPDFEPIYRAHLIVDYITGMTDTHALKIFRMLRGMV